MSHGPNIRAERDNAFQFKKSLGIAMFFIYSIIYCGFIVINVVNPDIMGVTVLFGVNLAIVYGFGLIILAIVLGLIYNALCTNAENKMNVKGGKA